MVFSNSVVAVFATGRTTALYMIVYIFLHLCCMFVVSCCLEDEVVVAVVILVSSACPLSLAF